MFQMDVTCILHKPRACNKKLLTNLYFWLDVGAIWLMNCLLHKIIMYSLILVLSFIKYIIKLIGSLYNSNFDQH